MVEKTLSSQTCKAMGTVAILAQGTSWADAATQAFFWERCKSCWPRLILPRLSNALCFETRIFTKLIKADSTLRCSQAVPHPSTNRALRRLTSEVERDPVYSTRYGRQRSYLHIVAKTTWPKEADCTRCLSARLPNLEAEW